MGWQAIPLPGTEIVGAQEVGAGWGRGRAVRRTREASSLAAFLQGGTCLRSQLRPRLWHWRTATHQHARRFNLHMRLFVENDHFFDIFQLLFPLNVSKIFKILNFK